MGWLKWPNLLLVLTALYLSMQSPMGYYSPPEWINLGPRSIGSIDLNIYAMGRIRPGEEMPLLIKASDPVNLIVSFSGEGKTINISINENGEEEFTLITPNQTSEEVVIEIKTNLGDSAYWDLGRLYR